MEKAIKDGWKALLGAGVASMVGSGSLTAFATNPGETRAVASCLLVLGVVLTLLAIYGFVILLFPSMGPPPQMLQDRLLWTAKRYRTFAEKHKETGDEFCALFWKKYPYPGLSRLAARTESILGKAGVFWPAITELPSSPGEVRHKADYLEQLALKVPPGVPF
jgi:hypothetical protein